MDQGSREMDKYHMLLIHIHHHESIEFFKVMNVGEWETFVCSASGGTKLIWCWTGEGKPEYGSVGRRNDAYIGNDISRKNDVMRPFQNEGILIILIRWGCRFFCSILLLKGRTFSPAVFGKLFFSLPVWHLNENRFHRIIKPFSYHIMYLYDGYNPSSLFSFDFFKSSGRSGSLHQIILVSPYI